MPLGINYIKSILILQMNRVIKIQTKTFLRLIAEYSSPAQVVGNSKEVIKLMKSTGGHFFKDEKIREVIKLAESTKGIKMTEYEELELKFLDGNTLLVQAELKKAKNRLSKRIPSGRPFSNLEL